MENEIYGKHYMILAPGDFVNADCDGFIFSSSNIGKVSAFDKINAVVNFTILGDNYPEKSFIIDDIKSSTINSASDIVKIEYNLKALPIINLVKFIMGKKLKSKLNYSGQYPNQKKENTPLNTWWIGIVSEDKENLGSTQEEWQQKYENDPVQKDLQKMFLSQEKTNEEKK